MTEYTDQRLKTKTAIVTGGGRGIGGAIASRFSREGANIVIADVDQGNCEKKVNEIMQNGGNAIFVKTNMSKEEEIKNMISEAIKKFNIIDIVVNNAGLSFNSPIQDCSIDDFNRIHDLDLRGVWLCCREISRHMINNKKGRIINIASTAGIVAQFPNQSIYDAAKGGVIMLTRALAVELAQYNINVNCIAPSYIRTPIYEEIGWSLKDEENVEKLNKMVPMNRMGTGEEVAGAAFFLASDDSSYVTGDTILVDGGLVSW
ncbi:MAG: glucose 1-dehydrogenase [Actinomycetota bacterium]